MKDQAVGNSRVEKGISDQASQSRLAFIVAKVRSATREARRGRLAETSRVSQLHLFANYNELDSDQELASVSELDSDQQDELDSDHEPL